MYVKGLLCLARAWLSPLRQVVAPACDQTVCGSCAGLPSGQQASERHPAPALPSSCSLSLFPPAHTSHSPAVAVLGPLTPSIRPAPLCAVQSSLAVQSRFLLVPERCCAGCLNAYTGFLKLPNLWRSGR